MVQMLLDAAPAAAMAADIEGRLPLHGAAMVEEDPCQGDPAAVARLLLQADPAAATTADVEGWLPLHLAAVNGNAAVVRLLLMAAPDSRHAATSGGWVPLHCAAINGHLDLVRLLLAAAPEAAMAAGEAGWMPLHAAAFTGHTDIVRLLLEAAPQAATAIGGSRTPLQHAFNGFNGSHIEVARALLGAGPADEVLFALAASGAEALPLFLDFLLAPGRLPLAPAHWVLIPSPCPGIERALPPALACGSLQAAQVVQRMAPADVARLRTAALCLCRHGLPGDVAAPILAHCI